MERDSFGLPIKRNKIQKTNENPINNLKLNQSSILKQSNSNKSNNSNNSIKLTNTTQKTTQTNTQTTTTQTNTQTNTTSGSIRKAINPFTDPIPPKPRNPFDDNDDDNNNSIFNSSDLRIPEIFSSTHSYKQVTSHPNQDEENGILLSQQQQPQSQQQPSVNNNNNNNNMNGNEVEETKEEDEQVPHVYRMSQDRQSSRQNFRNIMLKAERSKYKRGHGEEVCAVDKNDENAVIRFLLSQRSNFIIYFC